MGAEVFELELLGGKIEQRYRRQRPEVEALPWGTLHLGDHAPEIIEAARTSWTRSAFQEYRTGVAVAQTLKCLIEARAPLDLIAMPRASPSTRWCTSNSARAWRWSSAARWRSSTTPTPS